MIRKIIDFIFFGNFYIGILSILLSVETSYQLHIPLCPLVYYTLLFSLTAGYYTYAYSWLPHPYVSSNPRSNWYHTHKSLVDILLKCYISIAVLSFLILLIQYGNKLNNISAEFWIILIVMILSGIFYYVILPKSILNLRNTGWLKAFTIGFTWACCVSFMPVFIHHWLDGSMPSRLPTLWFFIKNFMFCSVNAIMFDIKDYEDDTNKQLKTFVVRVGIRKTIFGILLPLICIGLLSFLLFAWDSHFALSTFLCNLLPFIMAIFLVLSLNKTKPLLYYLIVVDGILIFKAICGILGVWINHQ